MPLVPFQSNENENALLYNIYLAISAGTTPISPIVFAAAIKAYFDALPVSDPHVVNNIYWNGTFLARSEG